MASYREITSSTHRCSVPGCTVRGSFKIAKSMGRTPLYICRTCMEHVAGAFAKLFPEDFEERFKAVLAAGDDNEREGADGGINSEPPQSPEGDSSPEGGAAAAEDEFIAGDDTDGAAGVRGVPKPSEGEDLGVQVAPRPTADDEDTDEGTPSTTAAPQSPYPKGQVQNGAEGEGAEKDELTEESLKGLKREELDKLLVERGLDPADYANKGECVAALLALKGDDEMISSSTATRSPFSAGEGLGETA